MTIKNLTLILTTVLFAQAASATSPLNLKCTDDTTLVDDGVLRGPFKDNRSDIRLSLLKVLNSDEFYGQFYRRLEEATALVESIDEQTDPYLVEMYEEQYFKAYESFQEVVGFKELVKNVDDVFKIERSRCFVPGKPLHTILFVYTLTTRERAETFVVQTTTKVPTHVNHVRLFKQLKL